MEKGTKGLWHRVSSGPVRGPARQRGSVLALVTVGMLVMIGMAGLALQSGHLFVNKTHLQNALDAAALSAAKTLNSDGTVGLATAAGLAAFGAHVAPETGDSTFLEREMRDSPYTLAFAFSAAPNPFVDGSLPATFVRVSAANFTVDTWLANILPGVGDEQLIGGTAVAGPAPINPATTCDVLPLLMCAPTPADPDTDCSDGECFGWTGVDNEVCLKEADAPPPGCPDASPPATFRLLQLGGSGADEALAGGYSGCVAVGAPAATDSAVPVDNGLNTRFVVGALPPGEYPPDTVTTEAEAPSPPGSTCTGFCYDQYVDSQHNEAYDNPPPAGVPDRRKVAVPIGDCPVDPEATEVPVIGIGCFFLTRQATDDEVYGQLVAKCEADGAIAAGPPGGPHRIVLYKDPASPDS